MSPPRIVQRTLALRPVRFAHAAFERFTNASGASHGAAVAFYAAFSIAPLLVVVASVMVWLLGNDSAQLALLDALQRLIGDTETRAVADLLTQASRRLPVGEALFTGSWLALATTLVGAAAVFIELRAALQAMLDERPMAPNWWRLLQIRLLAIGMVLGCGFLLSVAMVAQTATLVALNWVARRWPLLAPLLTVAETVWSWGVISLLFAGMISFLPDRRLPLRHALAGAAVASALFMLGRYGISYYIATTATRSALGAAGSFAALLVWVYWSSQIFLLGAALAVELGKTPLSPVPPPLPSPLPSAKPA